MRERGKSTMAEQLIAAGLATRLPSTPGITGQKPTVVILDDVASHELKVELVDGTYGPGYDQTFRFRSIRSTQPMTQAMLQAVDSMADAMDSMFLPVTWIGHISEGKV